MFVTLQDVDAQINALVAAGRFDDALAHMIIGVHNSFKHPLCAHKNLYYPNFDAQIAQMGALLEASLPPQSESLEANSGCTLIIASELHKVGGHSRVVEDLVAELASPVVVVTDVFSHFRQDLNLMNWMLDALHTASIVPLFQTSMWAKCRALALLTRQLRPSHILYFQHHQDPLPFIGTLGYRGARKTLVHHCDHNPSLGNTLPGVEHVDLTPELAASCAKHLQRPTSVMPLYVPDAGCKTFAPLAGKTFSIVTSGSEVKFQRHGPLALQEIVRTALQLSGGQFFHIGPLADAWQQEIRAHLQASDVDPARFLALGSIPSLWKTLLTLDAHVYLGSAPVGGARAAIEAQGCGYPNVYFREPDPGSLLVIDSLYADASLSWSTLDELASVLKIIGPELPRLSAEARAFYERRFSHAEFRRVLGEMGMV